MTKRKRPSMSGTLGGMIVGFDQQIFRSTPPVQELVAKGQPVRGVSGEDGTAFEVVFPDGDHAGPVDPTPTTDEPVPTKTDPASPD